VSKLKKLFVFPEVENSYIDELSCMIEQYGSGAISISEEELNIQYLEENNINILISTGLSKHWYFTLKGMGIINITFGERVLYYGMADIVIDCKNNNSKQYFVSPEHSVCNNREHLRPLHK